MFTDEICLNYNCRKFIGGHSPRRRSKGCSTNMLPVSIKTLCTRSKKKEQDLSVLDHVFQEWRRRWEDPDYRKRCKKQSGNRRSERAGEGSGMSTHTCGSRSMREHERALV